MLLSSEDTSLNSHQAMLTAANSTALLSDGLAGHLSASLELAFDTEFVSIQPQFQTTAWNVGMGTPNFPAFFFIHISKLCPLVSSILLVSIYMYI